MVVKPIVVFEHEVFEDTDANCRIDAWRVPPGLPAIHVAREQFDDRSIAVPRESGSVWFRVWAKGERLAATATFAADRNAVRCDGIDVEVPYRLKGIATVLYHLASRMFAAPVIPSDVQSEDARAFWGGRSEIRAEQADD